MELKCLDLKVPNIFGKNNHFFVHSAYIVGSAYSTKQLQRFCKTHGSKYKDMQGRGSRGQRPPPFEKRMSQ